MKKPLRKAIFPVGGLGTRFLPATKAMPKEMLPVVDKPLIQYAVEEARAAGIEELIFVTGRGKSAIEDHFDYSYELHDTLKSRNKKADLKVVESLLPMPGNITYTRQQEPRGLGHAVWCARNLIGDEPFAVLLADDLVKAEVPCLKQMVDVYDKLGGNLVAVMDVPREHTDRYGILKTGGESRGVVEALGLVEKPKPESAPSTLSIIGRYILQPEVMEHLGAQEPGAGGEIQLTDAMAKMTGRGRFHGLRFKGKRFDCGDKAGFIEANIAFALDHPQIAKSVRESVRNFAATLT
ncbi:MAG TPA: UTP--glucose-1-phosphate uridylyltransferase GalU [Dongiaceae bacterium]|jgi:UTP--glucose-1-phosphate uridylyltransferase|nr:UTP--glucose-1-phosphate uridylyltransferase GalU [Dongiaceae bacterium]